MTDVIFTDIRTGKPISALNDLRLVMSGKDISPPSPEILRVPIEGHSGTVDLSEWTGDVQYSDRSIGISTSALGRHDELQKITHNAQNVLTGRRFRVVFTDDPEYYYTGRCERLTVDRQRGIIEIGIDFVCEPWKLRRDKTNIIVDIVTEDTIALLCDRMPTIPTITVSAPVALYYGGMTYNLGKGRHSPFTLREGVAEVRIAGTAVVAIEYQEGAL